MGRKMDDFESGVFMSFDGKDRTDVESTSVNGKSRKRINDDDKENKTKQIQKQKRPKKCTLKGIVSNNNLNKINNSITT